MPRRPTAYHRPESLPQALRLLAQPATVPLAGGTKLLARKTDSAVVDLQALGLNQIEWVAGEVCVGATVTLTNLANALTERTGEKSPTALLKKAIRLAGPNTYCNAATFGGIIASRLQDSELLATLLVLEAELTIHTPELTTMTLADYLAPAEKPEGLITQLNVSWSDGVGNSERVARTPADAPIVSITYWQPKGSFPRLAASGIGDRPARLAEAEMVLRDGISDQTITLAGKAAKGACHHQGDFRGDASYRAEMAAVLTRRVCHLASGHGVG